MFYLDTCKKIISFWSICNWYYIIIYFMYKVSQKWSKNTKMLRETKKSYILTCPFYYHIFFYLDNWQNKVNMAKVSLILSQFTQNIGHIYMFDYTRGTEEQHKPWELKKLSTWLYLTDSKECKIIPLISQKRSHRFGKKCSPKFFQSVLLVVKVLCWFG